ncbi:radical SAM family heme chaperone HemW [Maribacter sp. PR1]|uniref:Heme chaperone HemW n=1 Tax=Maribacter cobaltidurans TaxID=1178778 RepID=A0ABU7IQB8_9FLAO|nr:MULTISPECIES: radical SAM family heme chaperone HemW [Maribacter]MDC6387481.1 radical SAM family heme chaperone HemW [Maribacter sp. PR1]MEE1974868.1 radical SAM family heme chaperone HemW [Maribacter cobaltidurans]
MSGIYIHIPFCKQACHYCDFHFSTTMGKKEAMVNALVQELKLRKDEFRGEKVETIYFGGGTPTVLELAEINRILRAVYLYYDVINNPEITLEANPDDLSKDKIVELAESPINRLSIGIQSFFEEDLKLMNRAHNVEEAENCLQIASKYFDNISIDLIYGMPNMSVARWKKNIEKALRFNVPHISSYALTVEPKTALAKFVEQELITPATDEETQEHFIALYKILLEAGFDCYEISNFGKPGYFSKNNSAYWQQKKYMGIGPSAHSFDGQRRGWNINNNPKYVKAIENRELPMETEVLTTRDKYNEYIMTGLRTVWGVSLNRIQNEFGGKYKEYLILQSEKFRNQGLLNLDSDILSTTTKGKFLADGIAADLFMVNLS